MKKARTVFVGRERETEELLTGLDQAEAGHGSLFIVEGEPGVGKTRLSEEVAVRARERRACVLWSRCWEASGAPAYWPWIQLIRSCVREAAGGELVSVAEGALADIARILPEACEFGAPGHNSSAAPPEPEQAQFRLFDAVQALFRMAAAIRPLVLVLDDLGAADRDSLLLLRFIAHELHDCRLLLIATCRDSEVRGSPLLAEALGELACDSSHIRLRGLSLDDVGLLVAKQTEQRPDAEVIQDIFNATDGNPFFVQALTNTIPAKAFARVEDWRYANRPRLFSGLGTVIQSYLAPLSAGVRNLLDLAAVSGRRFEADVLGHATGLGPGTLLDALTEAENAGLITETPEAPGSYRFVHSLIRDTLYERLQAAERASLHNHIAEAILELYGEGPGSHLAELAHHFFEGAKAGSPERALQYARRAAERATALSAFEEAARCYQMALAAMKLIGRVDERERCELLLAMGEAQNRGADYTGSRDSFCLAADLAERLGDKEMLGHAALGYPGLYWDAPSAANEESIRLLERALKAFPPTDDPWRAMLMARLASELYPRPGARSRREALAREAVEMAQRIGDKRALLAVLGHRDLTLSGPDTIGERLGNAEQMSQVAEETESYLGLYLGFLSRTICFRHRGDLEKAEAEGEAMALVARLTRLPVCSWGAKCFAACRALSEGRFEEGERLARECLRFAERLRRNEAPDLYWPAMLTPLSEQGRLGELEPMATRAVEQQPTSMVYRALLALINCGLAVSRKARAEFELLAVRGFADIPHDNTFLACASALAQICAELQDQRRARQLFDILSPYADLNVVFGPLCTYGSVARYLGMLAAVMGRFQEGEALYEKALAFNERINARPYFAYTQTDYAAMLLRRGSQRDIARALELLASASEIAEAIGMKALAQRILTLKQRAEEQTSAAAKLVNPPETTTLNAPVPMESARNGSAPHADTVTAPVSLQPNGHSRAGTGLAAAQSIATAAGFSFGEAIFRRDGDYWTVAYDGHVLRLKHVKGLSCLAYLLGHPAIEVHSSMLAAVMDRRLINGHSIADNGPTLDQSAAALLGDAGPVLDEKAKAAYRRRLAELREELEEAKELGDFARATSIEEEADFLTAELSRAVGLGGRDRRAASGAERARLNVTKAIKAVLAKIAEHNQSLGGHLEATVRTGTFCSYKPDPHSPISWKIS